MSATYYHNTSGTWIPPATWGTVTKADTWFHGRVSINGDTCITSGYFQVSATVTKAERKEQDMRGLFEVFIVDIEDDTIHYENVVAKDEASARIKAAMANCLIADELDDYDFFVRRIGDVRAKKRVQEVKVVHE